MQISLADAAIRLHRSVRQVRYMVQKGELKAHKVAGVWMVDEALLPTTPADHRRRAEKAASLKQSVEQALAPHVAPDVRYGVTTLRVFNELVQLFQEARRLLPADHPAIPALADTAIALSCGAHAFRARDKSDAFERARASAAEGVAWLYLHTAPGAQDLALAVEAQVLPGIGGLVRRSESRRAH